MDYAALLQYANDDALLALARRLQARLGRWLWAARGQLNCPF